MIGGNSPLKLGDSWEYFDLDLNEWKVVDQVLPFDYFNHWIICQENDKIIIIGGYTSNSVN